MNNLDPFAALLKRQRRDHNLTLREVAHHPHLTRVGLPTRTEIPMNIDVAKVRTLLAGEPGVSLGTFDLDDKPAVVAVLLDLRHFDEAKAWVGGLIDRDKQAAQ